MELICDFTISSCGLNRHKLLWDLQSGAELNPLGGFDAAPEDKDVTSHSGAPDPCAKQSWLPVVLAQLPVLEWTHFYLSEHVVAGLDFLSVCFALPLFFTKLNPGTSCCFKLEIDYSNTRCLAAAFVHTV